MFKSKKHQTFLRSVDLFKDMSDDELEQVIDALKERKLKQNEVLFNAGEASDSCAIVMEGRLKATVAQASGRVRELAVFETGGVLGQIALLDGQPRSATITAAVPSTVLELSRKDFEKGFQNGSPYAYKLLDIFTRVLVRQLRTANARLGDLATAEQRAANPRHPGDPEVQSLFHDINNEVGSIRNTGIDLSAMGVSGRRR